jgi:NAD(P)-dependent dehydrogenase (short-subunit alcohol dehydrogenase family)
VTNLANLEAARDVALDHFGRVDLVMNNVGVLAVGKVEDIPLEAWQRIIDINLLGIVRSNLVFLPLLIEQGSGHLVNTASTAGLLPYGFDRLPYTATKHAVVGLSEALALYLRPQGIGVSCLCPAGVATNIVEQITFYGDPPAAVRRSPILEADAVGEPGRRRRPRTGSSSILTARKCPTSCASTAPTSTATSQRAPEPPEPRRPDRLGLAPRAGCCTGVRTPGSSNPRGIATLAE